MYFISEFLTVAVVHLLAVMSPGPDFVLISRNSLIYSRVVGVYSAVGLGSGILVHVAYSLIGIGFIISKSVLVFSLIKFIGAGYLIYIGYQSLKAKPHQNNETKESFSAVEIGRLQAIKMGFLTNVLNPKATLFFFALFTQVINPETPKLIQVLYGVEMSLMTFVWFSLVAIVLSHNVIRLRFVSVAHYLERFFGILLIALGIKVALSSSK
jgi:RhtB (resistance to homoserine/threonine) family protein